MEMDVGQSLEDLGKCSIRSRSGRSAPLTGQLTLSSLPLLTVASTAQPSTSASNQIAEAGFQRRKLARSLAVPTKDLDVRLKLRELGHPSTCFAEDPVDRRERLREALLVERQRILDARKAAALAEGRDPEDLSDDEVKSESEDEDEDQEEEFFTEGTNELLQARRDIAWFSLARAKRRLVSQKNEATASLASIAGVRKSIYEPLKQYTSLGSQTADERAISMVRFSPSGSHLATGSWSGGVKLWNIPSATHHRTLRGHTEKVGGVAWHPRATLDQPTSAVNLVSGAADNNVHLWNLEQDTPIGTLRGHAARVARVAVHPSGKYVGSASFDGTWRLWELQTQKELLLQEGHSKEVYSIEFQNDGALVASGGLDSIARLWDLRTGRTCMVLDGHASSILSIDFHPNGYQVATASGDDTCRIWDMRKLKSIYTIPAHQSSVSDVRFFRSGEEMQAKWEHAGASVNGVKTNGRADSMDTSNDQDEDKKPSTLSKSGLYLATSGYDGLLKVWSSDDWQLLRSLRGDNGKVMSCDIHPDGEYLASGEWRRTFKLWGAL